MGGSGGCSGGAPLGFGSLGAGTVRILVGALVVFVVVIVVSLVVFWQAGCPKGGFQCSDGKCLPRSRWCNAEVDCDDQEDELEDECLLRQSTKPSEKTNFPKFSITFCHLCVCPLPYNVEDCLQPHINNKGIVQCNVTSNRGGLQAPHQPSKRSIRSVQTSDAKMSGAGKRRVDRTDKEDTIDRKNKTNDIERSEKQMLVDWGRQNSKHGLSKPFHYHNIFGSVEEPKCVRPNMRHEGKRIQEYGYLRKLPFKIGHLSYNRPFKRQHKSRVARDCKFAEHTNNIRNIYQQPTPRRLATRTQGVDHSNVFLNWKARTDSHTLRPLHTRSLELLFFKIPQNQTQTELTRPYQKKSKYTKAIELLYHRPILEGRIGLPDTPTKKYDQSLFQWKKKGRLHLMYDAVPGVVDQPKNTKASERGKRDLKVGVSRAGSGYSEGDRRFPHDKVPGHQQKEKHQKETHSGHQREEVYKTVVSYHHGDSNIGELNTGLFNNELVVYDYKTGDYDHKTGSYDQEKVIEQLKDMCYCELDTQLKCPHTGLAQVPHRIVGGITLLNIKGSEVFSLDAAVMSQYSTLTTLSLEENLLESLSHDVFSSQSLLENLYLSKNFIQEIHHKNCFGLRTLLRLFLDRNRLYRVDLTCFIHTPALQELNLAHNELTLDNQSFPHLPNLTNLYLNNNSLTTITERLLFNLTAVRTLQLQDNKISVVAKTAFRTLTNLQSLSMSGNLLTSVRDLFRGLSSLYMLKLEDLELLDISEDHFSFLSKLKIVYFHTFRYCSYVPKVPQCLPNFDGVSNSRNLMGWWVLRVGVWVVAAFTVCGNILVICCRAISRNDNKILKLFIKNLAAADLLMGVYLVVVGVEDVRTRGKFHSYALHWASSYLCTFAGILALVSSETSVFILTFMSLERYLYISEALDDRALSERSAKMCLIVIWLTSISLALFPTLWVSSFYGSNAMCFPLHINEPYLVGWQYSAFIFLGLNIVSMVVIFGSYTGLFFNIRVTRLSTPLSNDEMNFALRFFFIVVTNCLCWLPIMCVKVAALAQIDIHQGVYAWLVVLVLPINSAVNPGLYTFSTSQFQSQVSSAFTVFRRAHQRQNSDTEGFRHSSTRVWGSNIHNAQISTLHHYHHPLSAHPLSPILAPINTNRKTTHIKQAAEVPTTIYQASHKAGALSFSSVEGERENKLHKFSSSSFAGPQGVMQVASEGSRQSGGRSQKYNQSVCPQSRVTFSAKVTQVRLNTNSHGDGQMPSSDHTHSSPVKGEIGSSPTHLHLESFSQGPRDNQTFTDAQGFQDICLEAHVSRHGNIHCPAASTLTTFSSSPSFQGNPLYVDCSASATSDFKNSNVLQLNLKVSYTPELIQSPSHKGSSGINNSSSVKMSPETPIPVDMNKTSLDIPQVIVGTSSSSLRQPPAALEQSKEETGDCSEY